MPRKEYWNLYRDGVTQGALNLFLTCREQFRLRYLEGWVRKGTSEALDFGTLYHGILEHVATADGTQDSMLKAVAAAIAKARRALRTNSNSLTETDIEKQQRLIGMAEALAEQYIPIWIEEDSQREWIAREETFNVPVQVDLRGTTGHGETRTVPVRGRWDGVFKSNSKHSLLETKTKAVIDEEGLQASLPFDLQTMLYCYTSERTHEQAIGEIIYDVIRRPGLRIGNKESLKDFLDRVRTDIADRPTHYFKRWRVVLAKGDVKRWHQHQLLPVLRQLCEWYDSVTSDQYRDNPWRSPLHFLNPNALFSRWGRCELFHLITSGQSFDLRRLNPGEPFPELEED